MFDAISHATKINGGEPNPVPPKRKIESTQQLVSQKLQGRLELKPEDHKVSDVMLDDFKKVIEMIHNVRLDYSIHKESGTVIARVVEKDTGRVVREIPNEEILDLVASFDQLNGILFNRSV